VPLEMEVGLSFFLKKILKRFEWVTPCVFYFYGFLRKVTESEKEKYKK
jgi:hypothetical protein